MSHQHPTLIHHASTHKLHVNPHTSLLYKGLTATLSIVLIALLCMDVALADNHTDAIERIGNDHENDANTPINTFHNPQAVVLLYHRFNEPRYPSTQTRIEQFEAHLAYLKANDYTVLPLTQISAQLKAGKPLPAKTVAITIDDAYKSVYTQAYPRLKHYGYPFTVFVSTDTVDQRRPDFMDWSMLVEMGEYGAHYGNHSRDHGHLAQPENDESIEQWRNRIITNLQQAQQRILDKTGQDTPLFAYPYGEYSDALATIVIDQGYIAYGQHSGPIGTSSRLSALPRFPMAQRYADMDQFTTKIKSLAFPVISSTPSSALTRLERPSLTLLLGESDARLCQLACYSNGHQHAEITPLDADQLETAVQGFVIKSPKALSYGRSRYNCTAPSSEPGRYYWFSHLWLRPKPESTP